MSPRRVRSLAALASASLGLTIPILGANGSDHDAAIAAAATDPATVKQGKEIYAGLCKACHGEESAKGDSPSNLFDGKWFRGSTPGEIEAVILKGVQEKGMPAWGEVLPPEDTTAVTAYLLSVQKSAP